MTTSFSGLCLALILYRVDIQLAMTTAQETNPAYLPNFVAFGAALISLALILPVGNRIIRMPVSLLIKENVFLLLAFSLANAGFQMALFGFDYNGYLSFCSQLLCSLLLVLYNFYCFYLLRIAALEKPVQIVSGYFFSVAVSLLVDVVLNLLSLQIEQASRPIYFNVFVVLLCAMIFFANNCGDYRKQEHRLFGKSYINSVHFYAYATAYGTVYAENNLLAGIENRFDVDEILSKVHRTAKPQQRSATVYLVLNGMLSSLLFEMMRYYIYQAQRLNEKYSDFMYWAAPLCCVIIYGLFLALKKSCNAYLAHALCVVVDVAFIVLWVIIGFTDLIVEPAANIVLGAGFVVLYISAALVNTLNFALYDQQSKQMNDLTVVSTLGGYLAGCAVSALVLLVNEQLSEEYGVLCNLGLAAALAVPLLCVGRAARAEMGAEPEAVPLLYAPEEGDEDGGDGDEDLTL